MPTNSFKLETLSEFYEEPSEKPTSFATNSTKSINVFKERKKYREEVFPDGTINNMFDTWGKDSFYGILNTKGNSVIPNDIYLKPLRYVEESNSLYAVGFVADAFRDFAEKMRELADNGVVYKDSPWAAPTAKKAMTFAANEYNSYMLDNLHPVFRDLYISRRNRSSKIMNFNSFLDQFSKFQKDILKTSGPLSLSGFMESSYSSVLMSGLVIEIGDDKYDNDENKSKKYGDVNFQMAARIAEQYGFSIDRNIPWRLVANINNPAMQEYIFGVPIENIPFETKNLKQCEAILVDNQYPEFFGYSEIPQYSGIKRHINVYIDGNTFAPGYRFLTEIDRQSEDVFEKVYDTMFIETWKIDIDFLKTYLLEFYNAFVRNNPQGVLYELTGDCLGKVKVFTRQEQGEDVFSPAATHGDLWFLKSFYIIRSLERQMEKEFYVQIAETRKIINMYDHSSAQSYQKALEYTQQNFIGPYLVEPLTYTTVADIISKDTESDDDDISDLRRQVRVRRNLY